MSTIPNFKLIRTIRKTLSIHVTHDGEVIVKAPIFIPSGVVRQFVGQKIDWIKKHVAKTQKLSAKKKKQYTEGEEFMYLGKTYKLHVGNFKEISLTDTLNFPHSLVFRVGTEIKEWYVRQAKRIITERVKYHADIMKAQYINIKFSDTISKWGSCTAENSLQFNWRLIMAPILVIDYVVVHELVHTWDKNHGRKFWNKVSYYKPAYKQYRKWLNDHSRKLLI